jgi:myo-inositol-1(or 4)-monophosphatase
MSGMHYKESLEHALEVLVREVGRLLLSYRFQQLPRIEKRGAGFVTHADLAIESFLVEALEKLEPGISFFTEEQGMSTALKACSLTAPLPGMVAQETVKDYCWVIDPLDGTTNFSYGLPHFCISLALTYKHRPQLGIVYQPLLDEFFYAQRGRGAFLNGQRLTISSVHTIADSFLLFCMPYKKDNESKKLIEHVIALSQESYSMRLLGAAALDQAYMAAGRLDGMFFNQLSWWDVAAGSLLIEEAGGIVSDFQGNSIAPSFESYLAATPLLYEKLRARLSCY